MALISDTRIRAKIKFTSTIKADTYEVHIIDDDHTTPAPLEQSDFSVNTDGWGVPNANDSATRLASFAGVSNVLEFNSTTSASGTHSVRKNVGLVDGTEYRVTAKVYIPSTNTTLKRVHIDNDSDTFGFVETTDQWVDISINFTGATNPRFFFSGSNITNNLNFTSTVGDKFYVADVVIYEVADLPLELEADKDGFTLDYRGNDDIQYLLGSEFSAGFYVTNTDTETLASDILSLQEDRFGVRVYKDEELYWHGMLYQDGFNIDIQHKPYVCRLTAMCGLGRLKQISKGFPDGTETYAANKAGNLATIVLDILKETDPLELGNSDTFLRSFVDFRSNNHRTYASTYDTLGETFSDATPIFYKSTDFTGVNFETRNYHEALERILKPFFSRVLMQDGAFAVIPMQKYKQIGAINCRVYGRSYVLIPGSNPTTASNVDYSTKTLVTTFTNEDNLTGLSMSYEEACDRIVSTEKFNGEVNNIQNVHLEFNSDSHTYTTDDQGYLEFVLTCGNYRFENTGLDDLEVWAELRAVVSTVYNSQTWYWGPQRHMSGSSHFGQPLSSFFGWSTTERWITLSQTNYFDSLKTGTHVYPYHSLARGHIDAGELDIIQSVTQGIGRGRYAITWLNGGINSNVLHVIHPSGGQGSVTLKVESVALNKSHNTVNTDIDVTTPITQAEYTAAGITNGFQGTKVNTNTLGATTNLIHVLDTGEVGRSVKIRDIGTFMLADERNNGIPTMMFAWDGTDWDSKTNNWAEGSNTPDGPLVQLVLREWATIFQKPVKRPDMAYIESIDLLGQVVPSGKPFPLGVASSTNNYMPVRAKFIARDDVREETWLELDTTEVTNTISTTNASVEPFIVSDGINSEGTIDPPDDPLDTEGYQAGVGVPIVE